MSWLTKIALKKRWITFLIIALVTGVSFWSTLTLKMELLPDIQFPVTSVITIYPQAKPEEVVSKVTIPVEGAIADIDGLDQLISTSSEGSSFIIALFEYGTDMDEVNSLITQNLAELDLPPAVRELPAEMPQLTDNPQLYAIDINASAVVSLSLTGDISSDELEEIALSKIIPRLEAIDGVYQVGISGSAKEKVLIDLNPSRMNEFGISMSQVAASLASQQYNSLEQVEDTLLGADVLLLKDIAGVTLGPPPGTALTRTNGKPSFSITIMKESEANTVAVANRVAAEVEKIQTTLGDKVELVTVFDQSEFIERSISSLARNAILGFALASVVVFLFLMAFRASLVTAISIPLSILIGFIAMRFSGITINILTLSAMAIVVGKVIDNSIVVLEVIYRRIQHGEAFREAAINGVKEVAIPITSATIATIVIFVPLAFLGGIIGQLFVPFALTITFALIASWLVALTVVPALSNFPLSKKAETQNGIVWYQRIYTQVLKWCLARRAVTLVIAGGLFLGSFALVPIIGTSFIPSMIDKSLRVEIEMPVGTDLRTVEGVAMLVEEVLAGEPEITVYQTTVGTMNSPRGGGPVGGGGSMRNDSGSNSASITVLLQADADLDQTAAELIRAFDGLDVDGVITVITGQQAMAAQMSGSGLDVSVRGENHEDIARLSEELFAQLATVEGIADLEIDIASVEPKLNINLDRGKLMASGLPMEQLQQIGQEFLLMSMGGTVAQASIEGKSYEVFLEGIVQDLDSVEIASELRIGWPQSLPLSDIAAVELGEQPTYIQRIDQKQAASITGSITLQDTGAVNQAVQKKIDTVSLPPGTEIKMGGAASLMGDSFSGMFIAILVAILLAYAVIVVTFRSFINPIIIMMSLPLASIGALLGLLIAGQTLGISAMMGVLMLVGIVLTNAIMLIALVEQLRKGGATTYDSLVEGGRTRLRPILMTALTTMIAMLPLALGLGESALVAAELAVVVIGGLFSSTLLTLLVVPVLYSLVSGLRRTSAG